jgi:hypothetical protein
VKRQRAEDRKKERGQRAEDRKKERGQRSEDKDKRGERGEGIED